MAMPKRSPDINQLAKSVVDRATGNSIEKNGVKGENPQAIKAKKNLRKRGNSK